MGACVHGHPSPSFWSSHHGQITGYVLLPKVLARRRHQKTHTAESHREIERPGSAVAHALTTAPLRGVTRALPVLGGAWSLGSAEPLASTFWLFVGPGAISKG